MSNYFSVHVISGHEQKVKSALLNRAVAYKAWQETIFDILIPTEKTYETRGNKRKIVDKKVMPGYVFIKMYLDQDTERIVQGTVFWDLLNLVINQCRWMIMIYKRL